MSRFGVERPGRGVALGSVDVTAYRREVARRMSESELLEFVRELAGLHGWLFYHTFDSRRSGAGFPDVVLVHQERNRLVFAELKTERGKVRPEQEVWMRALAEVAGYLGGLSGAMKGEGVEVFVWRPSDMDEIEAVLSSETGTAP